MATPSASALSFKWKDKTGYSFGLDLQADTPSVTIDTADAPPGQSDLKVSYSSSGTLANGDSGHNEADSIAFEELLVMPVWKSSSPACKHVEPNSEGGGLNDAASLGGGLCGFYSLLEPWGTQANSTSQNITPGQSEQVTSAVSGTFAVDESDASTLDAALSSPYGYVLLQANQFAANLPGSCGFELAAGMDSNIGGIVAASVKTSCVAG